MPLSFASDDELKTNDPRESHLNVFNTKGEITKLMDAFVVSYDKGFIKTVKPTGHIIDGSKALRDNLTNPEGFVYVQKGLHQDTNTTADKSHPQRDSYLHLTLRIGGQNVYHAWVLRDGSGKYRITEVSTDQHLRF